MLLSPHPPSRLIVPSHVILSPLLTFLVLPSRVALPSHVVFRVPSSVSSHHHVSCRPPAAVRSFEDVLATYRFAQSQLGEILSSIEFMDAASQHCVVNNLKVGRPTPLNAPTSALSG